MFFPEELFGASEVFYTNTTAGIMPVSMVDDVKYDVGELTLALHELYKNEVVKYIGKAI